MDFLKQNRLQRRTEIKNNSNKEAFNVPRTPLKVESVMTDEKCKISEFYNDFISLYGKYVYYGFFLCNVKSFVQFHDVL